MKNDTKEGMRLIGYPVHRVRKNSNRFAWESNKKSETQTKLRWYNFCYFVPRLEASYKWAENKSECHTGIWIGMK